MAFDVKSGWDEHFPECPPVGYLFKHKYPDLWVRIHTLPESKQYPDTEGEFQEILRRHNTICSDLYTHSNSMILLLTHNSRRKRAAAPRCINHKKYPLAYMASISLQEIEADLDPGFFLHIWSCNIHWQATLLDNLLRKVANEEIKNLLLVDFDAHHLYYPYPGGADIILASSAERDSFIIKYRSWLSQRLDGF